MTPSRVVRVLIALLFLISISSPATAATTEFRVLFDVDNDADTGCTVNEMNGVEQVLVTEVTEGDPMRVTRTYRQHCMGMSLGSPMDINTEGWGAGWNPTNNLLTVETRIPFMAFGAPDMPRNLRVGFDATRTVAEHTAFVNADGTQIVIPPPPVRRRAISPDRHITMNGNLTDWGRITPAVFGVASNGTDTLRLLRILAWPDTNDNHVYFAVTAYLGSDHPWADDNHYQRLPGESLSVNAPGVLDNDGMPGNPPLSAEKVTDPSRGTVTLNPDGSFTYAPTHPQLLTSDEFEYKAKGAGKESNVARVIIKVSEDEAPPSCPGQQHPNAPCPDFYTTREETELVKPAPGVLENDPHKNLIEASLVLGQGPHHGQVELNPDGSFTYTPADDFFGTDTFVYLATKKQGAPQGIGGQATVTITVTNVNDEPSFTPGPSPVTTTASSGPFSQVWATNISAGTNEPDQDVNFVVSNDNTGLFAVQPAISPTGVLTFTPGSTQGTATVSVRLEDNGGTANGGDDTSPTVTFTIIISCGSITVMNPATNTATVGVAFSQNFTQTGAVGGATFTTSSTLPAGLTLATNGTLSGTPTEDGTFPIVVTVTDGTGCMASGPTYNLVVNCQTITVTNPANANGTAASPFSETFTQAGGNGLTTFSLASGTLPAGLTLAANGVLSGTPTQAGSFPITVMATDANGCTGTGGTYNLTIGCQTITVTNPANGNGTAGSPFSETFTQAGGIGATTFSLASGVLPAGLTLAANGVLSGTPTQTGPFSITVTATDSNGCTGTGVTYNITIGCQTITVNNPANANGTVSAPFSETFTQTGAIGSATFTTASTLPAGLTLATNGVLSGTPLEDGLFPIVVTVTDANSCTGTSATYNLTIGCQTITVTNPVNTGGTVSAGFSETFTQTGAVGGATFTLNSGVLPNGLTLATNGTLSGTPTEDGSFPITVLVTDGNGCTGVSATYNLVIACQTITVTNPANDTGAAGSPFSETFTQAGAVGGATFTLASGTLPTGLTLSTAGVLSGTPTQGGTFPITVLVTDGNGCTGIGATYNLNITCQTITVTNPANTNGTASSPFSETFTQAGAIGSATFTTSSTLPTGLSLSTAGVLSGTPTQTGVFPIVVTVTDSNGCTGVGATYNLTIACQTITVNNPANANGTAGSPFSETFTQIGGIGTTNFSLASGTLPAGLTLAANGVLSGTPTQTGVFPITVTATDSNGCTGTSATYNLTIGCQTITVTNPANANGTVSAPFSEIFTQTGAIGTATFTLNSGVLPNGLTLATNGTLSGTPTEDGVFPITVLVTDSNSCTGVSATYNLTIGCQTITVTNPVNTGGTVNAGFSETFTQTGAVGGATFTLNSGVLPNGLTLATNGTLSGTPTEDGSFPITVLVTDGNGCTGVSATYNLNIACQTITVTNPANATGPAGTPFSETFTQIGAILPATFTTASTLPTGLSLSTAGVLSGTPTQGGTFPIVVTVTDANGCTGVGPTYNLIITCPTITVTNPVNGNGTANAAFSETFTSSGGIGAMTYTIATGVLPTGLTLAANGVLSGIPTQTGSFPITVTATDSNGCQGTGTTYTINIACQTITVNNPANSNGTANAAFSETFTATNTIGATTFSLASGTLPTGLSLAANGVLSGIPTQTGSFPITVTATDANGCTGTSATYTINIACQTITVNNPANSNGIAGSAFSETFTATNAIGATTFSLATGTLPTGLSLAANGVLSGIPTQTGSFPITVTATDANGCQGTGTTYTINIACQTITVNNPANASGTVNAAFSETFTQVGAIGTATFTTASTLPTGLSLAANGVLSGIPTQSGTFPIVVTVTDSNGCTGTSATYNLTIACQTITVTNPGVTTGTAGTPFSQMFTQTGAVGTATFTTSSTLPAGLVLQTDGTLAGTPTSVGTFPIVVTVTDSNGCTGTSATYNLVISCQTITITNPATTSVQAGTTLGAAYTFTAVGILGTANWTLESGTLPVGITLNATSGQLEGSSTVQGSYPITVRVTDTNGCFDISDTYTLDVVCPVITVARTGGGAFPAGVFNTAYTGESFAGSGGTAPYTFAVTGGTFPTGLTLAANGTISGTPTQTGTFIFTVTATDASLCPGSQSFTIAINPFADPDTYSNLVNNTQAVVTGTTTAPTTPHVVLSGLLIADDQPSGGVVAVAGTFATTQGGSVTIAADGSFLYTPPVTVNALATDSFTYTIASNTGGTGTPTMASALVTLNLANRVWYVRNNAAAGDGRSHSPFNSTSGFTNGARATPDKPNDIIFIHRGDGTTANLTSGVVLLDNEQLIGEGVALVVNTHTLVIAGLQPQLTNSTPGDVIVLGNGNTVRGLTTTGGTNGISGASKTAFTGGNLTLQNATSSGIVLSTFAGAVTLTNTTITNNGIGVNLAAGTATTTIDNTNSITANAGQRSINFNALGATAVVSVGATITDNGLGIAVSNSVAGAAISFTGTQTLSTGGNIAVNLATNTGATITFGGTLGVTTTTGSGFTATGGGTLNVGAGASTANVTTGAAGTASVNITGMTIGAGGVTFDTVNATAPATGINVVNNNGTVSVNGGTINNAGNGAHMQGATTNLSLAGVTIGGTTTTGINTTTNFGTLTIGASVNVSAATALNLNTGAVSGTFNNVTSTGGTNGVNLNAVTGTWGATAGALSGASGATFNVTGGSANITWGPTVSQANAANVVTIATSNSGTINFNGNVSSTGTSTGLSISNSSGTYNFNGAGNTFSGAGGITIGPSESGTITFSNGTTNTTTGTAFNVAGGGGAVTAAITYSGTINKASAGILIAVDNLDTPGTLTMTHAPAAAGNLTQNNNGANGISVINSSSTNITISDASVTFNNVAAGFTASGNTGGTIHLPGLFLDGNGNKAGMLISGAGTINVNAGAANPTIDLSGGSAAASRAIDGTTVSFTGTLNLTNVAITGNANADIVTLTGSTLGGTGSTISGANDALVLSGVALTNGAGMTSIASTGGTNGISLTSITGGTYTVGSGGNLSGNTGSAFLVAGSSATFSYAGNITQNTAAQRAVNISGVTGGTITLSGAIGSSGGTGVTVAGTGGAVALTGTMTLSGTGSVFTVSGAGLTITAPSNSNVVGSPTAATATPVSITSSTIGAAGVTFQSVSANGAANGIVLNATGNTGAFLVRGDNTLARNGSGGTINNTSGDAIQLTSANNVTIQSMNLTSNGSNPATAADAAGTGGNHTVQVSGGSNVILSGVYIDGSDGSGYVALNVTGTNRLNNNTRFENTLAGAGHSVYVNNTNTNMTLFEVNNVQFIDNNATHTNFFFANTGTSNMTLTVQNNCLFEDLGTQALTVSAGGTAATTGTLTSNILNSDFQNAKGLGENNVGILVLNGANHVSNVQGNLFENIAKDGTIANTSIIRTQNSGGDLTATIQSNTIQNITYGAGFGGRHVIGHVFEPVAYTAGDSSTLFILNNIITNVTFPSLGNNREAIFIDYRTTASNGEVTIQGNNFNMPTSGAQQAMELRFRQTNVSTVNVLVRGNTGTHNTAAPFLDIDAEDNANVQLTVDGGNNFTNSNGTPGATIAVSSEDPVAVGGPPSICANITGNTLQAGAGTITLDETAGTMTVTQASAAAMAAANGIPGGNVTTSGTPAFGSAACVLP